MKQLFDFPLIQFVRETYIPTGAVMVILTLWCWLNSMILNGDDSNSFIILIMTLLVSLIVSFFVGLKKDERVMVLNYINKKIRKKNI